MTASSRGRRVFRAAAILAASALIFTACSDDKDSGGSNDSTTTTVEATGTPILIGGIAGITGPSTSTPYAIDAINAWADFINAKGGINGHPVEIDMRDSAGDPAKAQSLTTEILAKNPVLFLIEDPSVETAVGPTLAAAELPVMGVGYNPAVWGGYIAAFKLKCSTDEGAPVSCGLPNAFPVTTTFGAVVDEQVIAAQLAGATTLATAACAEVDSCSAAAPVFSATAKALGVTDLGATKVASNAADYTAECIDWIAKGADFIQISGQASMGMALIDSCADQGYEGMWGASAGSVHGDLITRTDMKLVGGLHAFPWWVDDPLVAEYRDAMSAAGVPDEGINDPTNTGLWSVLQLFAKAQANLSDAPTGAETLENMYTISNETLGGLIAPVTYTKDNPDRNRACFWPYILDHGTWSLPVGGLTVVCNPPAS